MKSRRLKNKTKQTTVITNMYGNLLFSIWYMLAVDQYPYAYVCVLLPHNI